MTRFEFWLNCLSKYSIFAPEKATRRSQNPDLFELYILNEYEYHVQLASPASPAQPVGTVVRPFARARSRCSKTIENPLAFAICLHKEIDASRFSGPEQFSAGAALILLLFAEMIFRRRFDRFPMPRSIEALKNDRLHGEQCNSLI